MCSSSYSCIYLHVVDDIGSNIESSHAATSQGTTQLVKASKTQRSNSSLVSPYVFLYSSVFLFFFFISIKPSVATGYLLFFTLHFHDSTKSLFNSYVCILRLESQTYSRRVEIVRSDIVRRFSLHFEPLEVS